MIHQSLFLSSSIHRDIVQVRVVHSSVFDKIYETTILTL